MKLSKIRRIIKEPKIILFYLDKMGLYRMHDKDYIDILYSLLMNKKIDWNNPKSFTEKLQCLKLYNKNPKYIQMVDKYDVKKYVSDIIGEEYIIKTLGIYDNFDSIDFDKLPNNFVIKVTHDSGGVVICKDKNTFDKQKAKRKIRKAMKKNFFYAGREWTYKNIKPRVLVEKYMVDESGYELKDYKFFCFNGKVKALFVATDRTADTETCFDFYDRDFNHLPLKNGHPNSKKEIKKPENYKKMIELAEKLSQNIPHVRVDFYNIKGKIYFGEMTFFHWSGFIPFEPEEWDYKFGEWLELPPIEIN